MPSYSKSLRGHTATAEDTRWRCTCGDNGEQPDDQRAQIAAQQHLRHPNKPVNVI